MKSNVAAGERAPEFLLDDVHGKQVRLSQFRGQPLILVFIGHLGSLLCRAHLAQLRQQYGKIQHKGGEVLVISFEDAEGLQRLINNHKLPFVVLLDPNKNIYCQYGMFYREKGPVMTWRTVLAYLRLRFKGYPRQQRGADIRQMGGDVVIDREGIVRFIHRSCFPEDRPEVAEMLSLLNGIS